VNWSIIHEKIPVKTSHDGHKISMEDCDPSPNKPKIHHKSQSDISAEIINIDYNPPSSALIKNDIPLEEGFTFDKSHTKQHSPVRELDIDIGSSSFRSKSTPGTKLHIITPLSPNFVKETSKKVNYT
jgi:hypothetical protein